MIAVALKLAALAFLVRAGANRWTAWVRYNSRRSVRRTTAERL